MRRRVCNELREVRVVVGDDVCIGAPMSGALLRCDAADSAQAILPEKNCMCSVCQEGADTLFVYAVVMTGCQNGREVLRSSAGDS